jgi:hypothetical protein
MSVVWQWALNGAEGLAARDAIKIAMRAKAQSALKS